MAASLCLFCVLLILFVLLILLVFLILLTLLILLVLFVVRRHPVTPPEFELLIFFTAQSFFIHSVTLVSRRILC